VARSPSRSDFPFRLEFPPALPISARAEEIVAAIQAHPVLILAGETGSGKTTQIPKLCLAAGRGTQGRIACTQPRRVAALSISRRVAEELQVEWGRAVGCRIRFQDKTSPDTVIKFLTDGMLLAEVQGDPQLREYDTIIIDEAHERSLNIDFLLGHLRNLRFRRPELKIIITSATIDTAAFSRAFDDAPVIIVEGRTFPVEVIYAPLDSLGSDDESAEAPARAEALHYVDGAVEAVERIVRESSSGDILVFLPSERDIRETIDVLGGRFGKRPDHPELVPLFGRLTSAEQQRIFAPTQRRKIVVATNIAETSLTIPGIRFVVDSGLARISRYAPQGRTRRLPIEPVSQSSADQRKGRSGRVADGVCIRLYSEKDFDERPRFTQPEIQRANLADVILRLKAFGLGDIERFPFLNMPAAKAIRAGYALLEELGALEREPREAGTHTLTPLGRELSRLPVDPTVGRMILQARTEKALREVLIIAAGLSIQDPRERPLDRQAQADAAHRRFTHPDSDFLTLLEIWDSVHGEFDTMSQSRLRRFCRDHFLSYTRMREWRDIHGQLLDALKSHRSFHLTSVFDGVGAIAEARKVGDAEKKGSTSKVPDFLIQKTNSRRPSVSVPDNGGLAFGTPGYRAIHRSVLTGLLGNIARLDEEKGGYLATHDRRVALFPGSTLFQREPKGRKPGGGQSGRSRGPRWIMAAEIMETSRLFARTCARLDPAWALELGGHVVRVAHSEPFWDEARGRVMVRQRTRLHGLEIDARAVGYGRINPAHATEIFIREALVGDTITWPFDFLTHNREVRSQVESDLTRTRERGYLNLDEAAYHFYAGRFEESLEPGTSISAVPELIDWVREQRGRNPRFLMMEADDLRDPAAPEPDAEKFPAALPLENRALPLTYAYRPGQSDDGVTLEVSVREAEALTETDLDWAVPGHLGQKIEHLIKALPKDLRRQFIPLAETARQLETQLASRDRLTGRREGMLEALAQVLGERSGTAIDPALWRERPLPEHLQVRVKVRDAVGGELVASRDLKVVKNALAALKRTASELAAQQEPREWREARKRWEKDGQSTWAFGDIPESIEVGSRDGVPVLAWPGLRAGVEGVALRLFETREAADAATRPGLAALLELQLRHDLGWTQRDLRAMRQLGPLATTLAPLEDLQEDAFAGIRAWICDPARLGRPSSGEPEFALTADAFAAALEQARADLRGLVPRFLDLLKTILERRQELLVHPHPAPAQEADLARLLPADFLRRTPFPRLREFPRYLQARQLRADRWRQNPTKDTERAAKLAPFLKESESDADSYRWLVEEFRVSLFAQELGTAEPVSETKLERLRQKMKVSPKNAGPAAAASSAVRPVPVEQKKPVKSLGALDKLFRK